MTKPAHSKSPEPVALLPWINGYMLDSMMRMGEACTAACQAWQREAARFVAARLESDGELGRKLMTCDSWSEMLRLQQDWAGAMAQDYLNQTNRLVQLASNMGAQMMAPETASTTLTAGSRRHTEAAE